jgi:hypothetical protein
MNWSSASYSALRQLGRLMRITHERWLAQALENPGEYPRIPTRKAGLGGWDDLMRTPRARAWADSWWNDTLDREDLA